MMFVPFFNFSTSSFIGLPPTSNTCFILDKFSKNFAKTLLIWVASSLVGEMIIPPISNFFHFSSLF